jgi:type III pantothenate kinase
MRELVADVGNSRLKVGERGPDRLSRTAILSLDQPDELRDLMTKWGATAPTRWTLAGSQPEARERLGATLTQWGHEVRVIARAAQAPIEIAVDSPDQVGIDRLLNAVAARHLFPIDAAFVIVNAGSAVTIDLVDQAGVFRGGVILPGFRLMAKALNDYTARLPLVETFVPVPIFPATNTEAAIRLGIRQAIRGAIERTTRDAGPCRLIIAGGDTKWLTGLEGEPLIAGPFLTLEGLAIAAGRLL